MYLVTKVWSCEGGEMRNISERQNNKLHVSFGNRTLLWIMKLYRSNIKLTEMNWTKQVSSWLFFKVTRKRENKSHPWNFRTLLIASNTIYSFMTNFKFVSMSFISMNFCLISFNRINLWTNLVEKLYVITNGKMLFLTRVSIEYVSRINQGLKVGYMRPYL